MNKQNPISLDVLAVLDAIERRGSFAKAAEDLGRATSAVSYSVQKLEEQLGITLFERQGRRSVLTDAGRFILNDGRKILLASQRLVQQAKEVATGWETKISVAIESILYSPKVFQVLADFLQDYSSIELDVREVVLNGGWEALDRSEVDLLIGAPGPAPQHKGYRTERLKPFELVAVMASKHPLAEAAQNPKLKQTVAKQLRQVVTHDTSVNAIRLSAGLTEEKHKFFVQNSEQKYQAIKAGIGVGHLHRDQVQAELDSGELIAVVLNEGDAPYQGLMAWKLSNKGLGLRALVSRLQEANC